MNNRGRPPEARHRIAFAHEFRRARAEALRDAEAFDQILFTLERFGSFLTGTRRHLGHYRSALEEVAADSHLYRKTVEQYPEFHLSFDVLYEEARIARNDAMHQGAAARHLSRHAQELALVMEDALMTSARTAGDFMVPNPVCAELWLPISDIRRTMLVNAFSFLPFTSKAGAWRLVSDQSLVQFVRVAKDQRDERLLMPLETAISKGLRTATAMSCKLTDPLHVVVEKMKEKPCLVFSKDARLAGIITAFDLL